MPNSFLITRSFRSYRLHKELCMTPEHQRLRALCLHTHHCTEANSEGVDAPSSPMRSLVHQQQVTGLSSSPFDNCAGPTVNRVTQWQQEAKQSHTAQTLGSSLSGVKVRRMAPVGLCKPLEFKQTPKNEGLRSRDSEIANAWLLWYVWT